MRVTRTANGEFRIRLRSQEESWLRETLLLHPLIPAEHHVITRMGRDHSLERAQKILDEAMAAQRSEHRRRLEQWLADPQRFQSSDGQSELRIEPKDFEWFLQVLNEVRIGSWIRLGCPEDWEPELPQERLHLLPYVLAMELCGWIQALLLRAS